MKIILFSIILILTFIADPVSADIIHLKTSEKLIGEVQDLGYETLHFRAKDSPSLEFQEIPKTDVYAVTDDDGLIIWPEELKGKLQITDPAVVSTVEFGEAMTQEEYQRYFMDQYLERQEDLNSKVGQIRTTLMVFLGIAVTGFVVAAAAN